MNSVIKALEEIGQRASLKQHNNLMEMLDSLNVDVVEINTVNSMKRELVCGLIPEDDSEDDSEE